MSINAFYFDQKKWFMAKKVIASKALKHLKSKFMPQKDLFLAEFGCLAALLLKKIRAKPKKKPSKANLRELLIFRENATWRQKFWIWSAND